MPFIKYNKNMGIRRYGVDLFIKTRMYARVLQPVGRVPVQYSTVEFCIDSHDRFAFLAEFYFPE
jgi:hypothetical protein